MDWLLQKHLGAMAENASIEDVMRMLVTARKQDDLHLWNLCSKLVAKSGLSSETLRKHNLPPEIVWELEAIRQKTGYGFEASMAGNGVSEQKTKRMQKALDSSDVELVKLMVMGEGLNLDKALALHYAVSSCSRYVYFFFYPCLANFKHPCGFCFFCLLIVITFFGMGFAEK
jgi:regulatory protein NPR1